MADEKATVTREHRLAALDAMFPDRVRGNELDAWQFNGGEEDSAKHRVAQALAAAYAAGQQSQASRDGWVPVGEDTDATLPGWFWVQFDDKSVAPVPYARRDGGWCYEGKGRDGGNVIAYCPALPPPPAPEKVG